MKIKLIGSARTGPSKFFIPAPDMTPEERAVLRHIGGSEAFGEVQLPGLVAVAKIHGIEITTETK